MTVPEAQTIVKNNGPCVMAQDLGPNGWSYFVRTLEGDYPPAGTKGMAWKVAAAAIKAEAEADR